MLKRRIRAGICAGLLAVAWSAGATDAGEALAFVTEVHGAARIVRDAGSEEAAKVGSQLFSGDELRVDKGRVVIIYVSGRRMVLKERETIKVEKGQESSSDLMERIMDTLDEIVGPLDESEKPVVHGMARGLAELKGALPANTRITHSDFSFSWDDLEGVEEYEFRLESVSGEVLVTKRIKDTQLPASALGLEPGQRYLWHVEEVDAFMPRSSGKSWIEILSTEESENVRRTMTKLEEKYRGDTLVMLKAMSLYRMGVYYDAERHLRSRQQKENLSDFEELLLQKIYARMERWDRLPAPADSGKVLEK